MQLNGFAWCRGCSDWKHLVDVRGGMCRHHRNEDARKRYAEDAQHRAERREHVHSRKRGLKPIPAWKQSELLSDFGGRCAYCPNKATTWDHLDPISKGGITRNGNVVPCCVSCNSSKKARDLEDWLDSREGHLSEALANVLSLRHEIGL
jgi:5-methylcytosine-specific restriction endonuclease McrA